MIARPNTSGIDLNRASTSAASISAGVLAHCGLLTRSPLTRTPGRQPTLISSSPILTSRPVADDAWRSMKRWPDSDSIQNTAPYTSASSAAAAPSAMASGFFSVQCGRAAARPEDEGLAITRGRCNGCNPRALIWRRPKRVLPF